MSLPCYINTEYAQTTWVESLHIPGAAVMSLGHRQPRKLAAKEAACMRAPHGGICWTGKQVVVESQEPRGQAEGPSLLFWGVGKLKSVCRNPKMEGTSGVT